MMIPTVFLFLVPIVVVLRDVKCMPGDGPNTRRFDHPFLGKHFSESFKPPHINPYPFDRPVFGDENRHPFPNRQFSGHFNDDNRRGVRVTNKQGSFNQPSPSSSSSEKGRSQESASSPEYESNRIHPRFPNHPPFLPFTPMPPFRMPPPHVYFAPHPLLLPPPTFPNSPMFPPRPLLQPPPFVSNRPTLIATNLNFMDGTTGSASPSSEHDGPSVLPHASTTTRPKPTSSSHPKPQKPQDFQTAFHDKPSNNYNPMVGQRPPNTNSNHEKPHAEPPIPKCAYCMFPPCKPTVYPYPIFDAVQDSDDLKRAMDGPGTNEKKLIEILSARSDDQVKEIMNEYTRQGSTLLADLKSDTSLNFKKILEALVTPLPVFYAKQLHKSLKDYDSDTVIEIMTSLSDCAIREVSVEYASRFKRTLAEKIVRYTNMDFEDFLLALTSGNRVTDNLVNPQEAYNDAQTLIAAGVDRWGTDEKKWFSIFSTRSFPQLREILKQYDELRKSKEGTIEKDITSEFSGKVEKGLLTLVKNIKDQSGYFADELRNVFTEGIGPWPKNNEKLIRIVRGRSVIDMAAIKQRYLARNKATLWQAIEKSTFGDYKKTLQSLVKV